MAATSPNPPVQAHAQGEEVWPQSPNRPARIFFLQRPSERRHRVIERSPGR